MTDAFPRFVVDERGSEHATQAFIIAFAQCLSRRLQAGATLSDARASIESIPSTFSNLIDELHWKNAKDMTLGMLAAGECALAGDSSKQVYDDASTHRALAQLRGLSEHAALNAFGSVGAAVLTCAGISSTLDLAPENAGNDVVSTWLSGVLLLRDEMRTPPRRDT